MRKLSGLNPQGVFEFFEDICAIPHGSEDMEKISDWCVEFAKARGLKCVKDEACNVVIYKDGTAGYENSEPIILQGHLDMVCQKVESSNHDFKKDSLELIVDGDILRANGTTLGGDNGIGSAMILAILDSDNIPHPPIEAVFTSDEETGMIGAIALDKSILKAKRMINLDSEGDTVTVSCAGGRDITAQLFFSREEKSGCRIKITLDGLKGGHSGVQIHKKRTNASILLGRVLYHLNSLSPIDLISITGGTRTNVITKHAEAEILVTESREKEICEYLETIKAEITSTENEFSYTVEVYPSEVGKIIESDIKNDILSVFASAHQGVARMSGDIEGLVESSQNLGIVKTEDDFMTVAFSIRSSKVSGLEWLEERIYSLFALYKHKATIETSGIYPPWEYKADSTVREVWSRCFEEVRGFKPTIEAIHAGLECGVFADAIDGLDCISVGADLADIHTPNERVIISSVERVWNILVKALKELK